MWGQLGADVKAMAAFFFFFLNIRFHFDIFKSYIND